MALRQKACSPAVDSEHVTRALWWTASLYRPAGETNILGKSEEHGVYSHIWYESRYRE
jgi:hypothetical protein